MCDGKIEQGDESATPYVIALILYMSTPVIILSAELYYFIRGLI